MRIAYIGDMVNRGHMLTTVGSSVVFLLSKLQTVDTIDVFCPIKNSTGKSDFLPKNVTVRQTYIYDNLTSLFGLFRYNFRKYDKIIFNILPTGVGNSTIANALMILLPLLERLILGKGKIVIVYHNSVYINNVKALGYAGFFNWIRGHALHIVENLLFKNISTFFLLRSYKDIVDKVIPNNQVKAINARGLEAVATVMLNKMDVLETITAKSSIHTRKILLHGFWGPQKDLEGALLKLSKLIDNGLQCKIIVSGGVNKHFNEYEKYFTSLLARFEDYVENYRGFVEEEDMASLLTEVDLMILPYRASGGHSGVLEQAIFFDIPTIAMNFLEYQEQSENANNVRLVSNMEEMGEAVLTVLSEIDESSGRKIEVKNKIDSSVQNMSVLLS